MRRNYLPFFATKNDLEPLLGVILLRQELQFMRAGLFDISIPACITDPRDDESFGLAIRGDNNHEKTYLVADRKESIQVEKVPQYDGGIKFSVSQKSNPNCIVFRPGGIFSNSCIIAGYIGTISESPSSLSLFQLFSKETKKKFNKIKSFYVGQEAEELLVKGWRLTSSVQTPSVYDLAKK